MSSGCWVENVCGGGRATRRGARKGKAETVNQGVHCPNSPHLLRYPPCAFQYFPLCPVYGPVLFGFLVGIPTVHPEALPDAGVARFLGSGQPGQAGGRRLGCASRRTCAAWHCISPLRSLLPIKSPHTITSARILTPQSHIRRTPPPATLCVLACARRCLLLSHVRIHQHITSQRLSAASSPNKYIKKHRNTRKEKIQPRRLGVVAGNSRQCATLLALWK